MIRIETDFTTDPRNQWYYNDILRSIIRGFSVADKNTEYFDTKEWTAPFSNLVPLVFRVTVSEAGTYLINTNQIRPRTIVAPSAGTFEVTLLPDIGRNTIRCINTATSESSENVIYIDAKELYGWIPAAIAIELLETADAISILKTVYNLSAAPLEVLERVYGANICATKQPDQTEDEFRRILISYYVAANTNASLLSIRTAPLGYDNIINVWTSLHHLEDFDSFFTYQDHIGDQSTMVLDRNNLLGFQSRPSVVKGNLAPGIYRYFVRAMNIPAIADTAYATFNLDVRHWGTPSTITLEWEQQGPHFDVNTTAGASGNSDWEYKIYKFDPVNGNWPLFAETRDHKYFDVGQTPSGILSSEVLSQTQIDMLSTLPRMRSAPGRNAFVRTAGHVTDQDMTIYIDNSSPATDAQRQIVNCMYNELVPADVRFTVFFLGG